MIALWSAFSLVRIDGADADVVPTLLWRWQKTPEEAFLAEQANRPKAAPSGAAVVVGPGDWPGFRGPARDGRVTGVTIDTDWAARPPELVWKHRVGPGWGSIAVAGDRVFTQEQRGGDEAVVCYAA